MNGNWLVNIKNFKYLGAVVTNHGSDEDDVEARCIQALLANRALKGFWTDKRLGLDIKIRLFKVSVLSVLTYGAESWIFSTKIVQKLRL